MGGDGAPNLGRVTVAPEQRVSPMLKPEGIPTSSLPLARGEAETGALPFALLGIDEVAQGPLQGAEGLLRDAPRALLPPGQLGGTLLLFVPEPVQVNPGLPPPLRLGALLAFIQAPLPGAVGRTRM
jgi:hypothetical protein